MQQPNVAGRGYEPQARFSVVCHRHLGKALPSPAAAEWPAAVAGSHHCNENELRLCAIRVVVLLTRPFAPASRGEPNTAALAAPVEIATMLKQDRTAKHDRLLFLVDVTIHTFAGQSPRLHRWF